MNTNKIESKQLNSIKNPFGSSLKTMLVIGLIGFHSSASAFLSGSSYSPALTKVDTLVKLQRTVYTSKFTCGIWQHGKTYAQLNQGIGAAPPLPREHSEPSVLPQLQNYYQDFQPGSYSTALNIFNPTLRDLTINVQIATESIASPQTVATVTIPTLNSVKVGCSDIEKLLPANLKGELVEGFFYISRFSSDLQVQAVYTYTTIAAFQEFRGGFVDDFGVIPGEVIDIFPANAGAGAGAGGLGLGGSVDIETIKPMVIAY